MIKPLFLRSREAGAMGTATSPQLWLVAVVLAILFAAFQIQSSFHSGALSLPVTYDDVMYFNEALQGLDVLYRTGAKAFLATFWDRPPHAPLSTLQAAIAFGLAGPHRWAADASNVIPLALLLRLFLGYATRWLPLATSAALAAAFLAFPLFGLLVLEFRPDQLCALFTACGALIITMDVSWMQGRRRTQVTIGALLVGALLAKPTLAPVNLVVFGVAVAASIFMHTRTKADAWRAVKTALAVGAICALVVLPYYAAVFKTLYAYIVDTAFGEHSGIWTGNSKTSNPGSYYLTGPGGQAAIGTPWLVLSGVLVLISAPVWIRQWRSAVAVLLVFVVAFASVTLPALKSPFIGLIVPALIVAIIALLTAATLGRLHLRWSGAAAVLLVITAMVTWRPVAIGLWGGPASAAQTQNFPRILDETVKALAKVPQLEQKRLYLPVIAQYLNADNLEFGLRERGLSVPASHVAPVFDGMDVQRAELNKADVVVLFSDDSTLPLNWLTSTGIRKEITQAVDQAGLVTVGTIDAGPYGGTVRVLARPGAPRAP